MHDSPRQIQGRFEEELSIRSLIDDMKRARYRQISSIHRKQKRKAPPLPPPSPVPEKIITIKPKEEVIVIEEPRPPLIKKDEPNEQYVPLFCDLFLLTLTGLPLGISCHLE